MLFGAFLMFAGSAFCVWMSLNPGEGAGYWTALWVVVASLFAFMGISLLVQRRR